MRFFKVLIVVLILVILTMPVFANWQLAANTVSGFLKAMNSLDIKKAEKYCAYQMKEYFNTKIKPFMKRAKKNPSKYKAHYYLFKKEKSGGIYTFYAFIHIYNQKAVRYAVFYVEKVKRVFKVTRMSRINPVKVITR